MLPLFMSICKVRGREEFCLCFMYMCMCWEVNGASVLVHVLEWLMFPLSMSMCMCWGVVVGHCYLCSCPCICVRVSMLPLFISVCKGMGGSMLPLFISM